MTEFLKIADEFSRAGLYTLLLFILFASWKRWWVWGYQLAEAEARCAAVALAASKREEEWKSIALQYAGVTRDSVALTRQLRARVNLPLDENPET